MGDPSTIYYREILYIGFIAISGFSALAVGISYRKLKRHVLSGTIVLVILPSIYAAIMIVTYLTFPPNPDKVTIPTNLIIDFRIAYISTIGMFWGGPRHDCRFIVG